MAKKKAFGQNVINTLLIKRGVKAKLVTVEKPNGVIKTGIRPVEGDVAPTVYIDELVDRPVGEAADIVYNAIFAASPKEGASDFAYLAEFEAIRSQLTLAVFNEKSSFEVFRSLEEEGFPDLVVVPFIKVKVEGKPGTTAVTSTLIATWGVTEEEVFASARANASKEGYTLAPMGAVLEDLGVEAPVGADDTLWVVTNSTRYRGAYGAVLLKKELRKKFPEGYYILPSSVHEVLVISKGHPMANPEELEALVKDVNASEVAPEEVLADRIYEF